jgi:hypothetical protein
MIVMQDNGKPQNTHYKKIGGSVYVKIPPGRLSHLEIGHIKDEDTSNKLPAKTMAEENEEGELYMSHWNPNAESQKGDE